MVQRTVGSAACFIRAPVHPCTRTSAHLHTYTAMSELPQHPSCLIDFGDPRQPDAARWRLAFGVPRRTLQALHRAQVRAVLESVQAESESGAWCVGYVSYEAAGAFDSVLVTQVAQGPLAWFAVYDTVQAWPQTSALLTAPTIQWQSEEPRARFDSALQHLADGIAAGDYYQVNLTGQLQGTVAATGSAAALALFAALQRAQPGGYAMYLDAGETQILSVSPELFFDWNQRALLTRPMKGTAPRGATPQDDAAQAAALRSSAKERAENVMIVDLLRNDLARIAELHSVRVPRLFHTEALRTVWQMTSDVEARTRPGVSLADVFGALFPCGSVSGAPKVPAMQAIRALESQPRGVYCGALGLVQPGGRATFNVPIRTVTLCGQRARCGVGSAVTAGSSAEQEWQEWRLKQRFVRRASAPFALLETLRLQDGCLHQLDAHLERMARAALHFGVPWSLLAVRAALEPFRSAYPAGCHRVRLLLDAQGGVQVQVFALPVNPQRVRLVLAAHALTQALDPAQAEFVQFKTTRRDHYEALAPHDATVFDTLLWNTRQEVTECTRGNIALLWRDRWVTPALQCGLLDGVERARRVASGQLHEAVITLAQLPEVRGYAFLNSLRGWIDAEGP